MKVVLHLPEGQQCSDPEKSDELGMGHVGGVFLVLVVGCACGILIGILEFLWNVRNVAIEKQVRIIPCQSPVVDSFWLSLYSCRFRSLKR